MEIGMKESGETISTTAMADSPLLNKTDKAGGRMVRDMEKALGGTMERSTLGAGAGTTGKEVVSTPGAMEPHTKASGVMTGGVGMGL
jgi:hypothetical protein